MIAPDAVDIPIICPSSLKIILERPTKALLRWSSRFFVNKFVNAQLLKNNTAINAGVNINLFIQISMTPK